ncbi:hypothetical protein DSAG12_00434 [Promethearchaeum syntrophicum]|uniref:Uncharacterized protein n=1 Tax=Promethearchaeum syntrophicum TaxID=2594042 RepID=A0A5B9D6P0_9ARCH|nr:hypothetical protein [Candidatus Prometheoarchaeum syntrophicum]QEE14621.1 hypothetical protein DSAG12_00434 [Candidatus Prometheoarchaeum syntrophicum]
MMLFKVQKSISFIPFDYPDPLMSEIFKYKYKSQANHWVNSKKSGNRLEYLNKLGYKIPVLENNEKNIRSYMTFNRKWDKPRSVRFPSPDDYDELNPHLSSLSQILKRINLGRKYSEPGQGRISINYKKIRRGLQKVAK